MNGAIEDFGMERGELLAVVSQPTMTPKVVVAAVNDLRSLANILCCPITHELFIDPVLAEDGRTYEKEAITMYARRIANSNENALKLLQNRWLSKRYTSPLDPSKIIRPSRLIENR